MHMYMDPSYLIFSLMRISGQYQTTHEILCCSRQKNGFRIPVVGARNRKGQACLGLLVVSEASIS
jgi:hypothetical protein